MLLKSKASKARAKKDKHNREKGPKRLEKKIKSNKLSKKDINNKGYNKYLKMSGEIKIEIDIETHICISFVAYSVYKDLERVLKLKESEISNRNIFAGIKFNRKDHAQIIR